MPEVSLDELITAVRSAAPEAGALDQLSAAVSLSVVLSETADALLEHFVEACRRDGHTWTDIGTALGVTKQAAQKRFVGGSMERFTLRAKHVIEAAAAMAQEAGFAAVQPRHVLVALFVEPAAIAARVLHDLGVEE